MVKVVCMNDCLNTEQNAVELQWLHCLFMSQVEEDDDTESREEEEKEELKSYSRRKIFSNWSRYEDTEKEGQSERGESQRGTDFSVLLSSAGKHFLLYRFLVLHFEMLLLFWLLSLMMKQDPRIPFVDVFRSVESLYGSNLVAYRLHRAVADGEHKRAAAFIDFS